MFSRQKRRKFVPFAPIICIFQRGMGTFLPFFAKRGIPILESTHCKTSKNSLVFALERSPKFVSIFEGFRGRTGLPECMFHGCFGKSVQFSDVGSGGLREKKKAVPAANCTDTAKGIM